MQSKEQQGWLPKVIARTRLRAGKSSSNKSNGFLHSAKSGIWERVGFSTNYSASTSACFLLPPSSKYFAVSMYRPCVAIDGQKSLVAIPARCQERAFRWIRS